MLFPMLSLSCPRKQRTASSCGGFTLMEMAVALGVVGLVSAGIWVAAASVHQKKNVLEATQQIFTIVQNTRQLYKGQTNFAPAATTLTATLLNTGVFPSNMVTAGIPHNPWGTTAVGIDIPGAGLTVASGFGYGGAVCAPVVATNVLTVVYWNLPGSAAINVLSNFIGNNAGTEVLCVYCDGMAPAVTAPAAMTNAGLTCGNPSNIAIYFKK